MFDFFSKRTENKLTAHSVFVPSTLPARLPSMNNSGGLIDSHQSLTTDILTEVASRGIEYGLNQSIDEQTNELHCGKGDLLTPLGLFVQGFLAFIAFTCLIAKRFCEPEPERRPWKIWFFDTSKQAIGAAVIHLANVFLANLFTGDPCTWYIVSFLLDSTVGLLVIYIGLEISQCIVIKLGKESLQFGEYGDPPQCRAWVGQCGLYILVMFIEKVLMTLLVLPDFWKQVREFIMFPIRDPNLELIIVMFIVPFIVNAIIFWVVDNFLKKKKTKSLAIPISSNTSAVKYFSAFQKVKYYDQVKGTEDSEFDVLLSTDEELCPEKKDSNRNRNVQRGAAQYSLLKSVTLESCDV